MRQNCLENTQKDGEEGGKKQKFDLILLYSETVKDIEKRSKSRK